MNLRRPSLLKKGLNFSDMATIIRCVRTDQSAITNKLIYVNDGNACFSFSLRRQEYFIPVGIILKCLMDVSDAELYEHLTAILTAEQAAADTPENDDQQSTLAETALVTAGVGAAGVVAAAAAGAAAGGETSSASASASAAAAAKLGTQFVRERALVLLSHPHRLGLFTRMECLAYLGKNFRPAMDVLESKSDAYVGQQVISEYVLVHLDKPKDKLRLLVFMLQKLWSFVDGLSQEDNQDTLMHHELYLPGHILNIFVKEKLQGYLQKIQNHAAQELVNNPTTTDLRASNWLRRLIESGGAGGAASRSGAAGAGGGVGLGMAYLGKDIEYMLNTGNLSSPSGLDLSQRTGLTIMADKLNWHRYLSHFRSVHRGAFFSTLRTTTVRKLLPESWGFMCPVHTPDGAPCGLLNHLAAPCTVATDLTPPPLSSSSSSSALLPSTPRSPHLPHTPSTPAATPGAVVLASGLGSGVGAVKSRDAVGRAVLRCLAPFGLAAVGAGVPPPGPPPVFLIVIVDGCVLGHIHADMAPGAVKHLRCLKATGEAGIPRDLEVAFIPFSQQGTFPGIFLFSAPARFVRPVRQLPSLNPKATAAAPTFELIGSLEQVFLDVLCPDGSSSSPTRSGQASTTGSATHEEVRPTDILSVMASLTPWSDYNQSPRNMYQCQMGKQTMGMPLHSFPFRNDNKLYRLQTPQTPIARTTAYDDYAMDNFPTGANAVVAVLAYTGYDMEDAMIINKSSMERGFGHGYIYKNELIDASQGASASRGARFTPSGLPVQMLGRPANSRRFQKPSIDSDGLPRPGEHISSGDVYACTINTVTGKADETKLKGSEDAIIDAVTVIGTGPKTALTKASVRLRFGRMPQIGDKFSSRHGQKGVLSQLWPDVDMPFASSSGMRPDIIINPHAFPSRMTIGMLVESVAAKSGALHGNFVDASPFRPSTLNPPPLTMSLKSRQPATRRGGSRMARSSVAASPAVSTPVPHSKLQRPVGVPATPATPATPAAGAAGGAGKGAGSFTPLDLPNPVSSAKPGQTAKAAATPAGPAAAAAAGAGCESNLPQNRGDLVDTFGRQLVSKGFSYYGTETMYSGVYGTEMECDIYLGVVYYQRLRHMVSDKFQVRSTGPVNPLTQQPVKGRSRGGGVRFGEMERDAMLSHGAAFLLHDRLHTCSDYHTTDVCSLCGSLLAPALALPRGGAAGSDAAAALGLGLGVGVGYGTVGGELRQKKMVCRVCGTGRGVVRVAMPFVFKYLAAELAAMNIKLTLGV
ncbi:hypothetical protein CLOM_g4176 [Closterium sp. NIES-68]|nr:hypothetical protein CLOM_g4176 [Closterium sp. NIES-68]GJP63679.1 hypothetical protein CLOP_g20741 [Closterium sp. NIES-67]